MGKRAVAEEIGQGLHEDEADHPERCGAGVEPDEEERGEEELHPSA